MLRQCCPPTDPYIRPVVVFILQFSKVVYWGQVSVRYNWRVHNIQVELCRWSTNRLYGVDRAYKLKVERDNTIHKTIGRVEGISPGNPSDTFPRDFLARGKRVHESVHYHLFRFELSTR